VAKKNNIKKSNGRREAEFVCLRFWPQSLNTTKDKVLCIKLYQYICTLLTVGVVSMIHVLVKNLDDLEFLIKIIKFVSTLLATFSVI